MELVKSEPIPNPHEHVDGVCEECHATGFDKGHEEGIAFGYGMAVEEIPGADTVRGWEAEALREAAKDAHRAARHGGRWEDCGDVVCSALERYVYERTRPAERHFVEAKAARMVAG